MICESCRNKYLIYICYFIVVIGLLGFLLIVILKIICGIEFSELGPIGDSIGGTMGPIISAISAILVYITFKEQIKVNEQVQDQFSEQRQKESLDKLYEYRKETSDNFEFESHKGTEAIHEFMQKSYCTEDIDPIIHKKLWNKIETLFTIAINIVSILKTQNNNEYFETIKIFFRAEYNEKFYKKLCELGGSDCSNWDEEFKIRFCESCKVEHGFDPKFIEKIKHTSEFLNN